MTNSLNTYYPAFLLPNERPNIPKENDIDSYVLIIHDVESYQAWKAVFDDAAPLRKSAGEISFQLLCRDNNSNAVVHFAKWSSLSAARQFFESEELKTIRKDAGVRAPEFMYLHGIEYGTL